MNETRRAGARARILQLIRNCEVGRGALAATVATAVALLAPTLASAAALVYHSPGDNGGAAGGAVSMASGSTETFHLWIHKGTLASGGDECITGGGDEICAYDVEVTLVGDATISFWGADDSSVVGTPSPDGKTLRINHIVPAPDTLPIRIGTMDVNVTGNSGRVDVSGRHIINAAQSLESVGSNNIALVPEPRQLLMLASGLLGLGGLAALRRRR